MKATQQQAASFDKWRAMLKVFELRLRQGEHVKAQAAICQLFADQVNVTLEDLSQTDSEFENLVLRSERMNKIAMAVYAERLALRFPNGSKGDFDIVAAPGMTDDEIAEYQLGIIVTLIASAVLIGSVYWTLDQHEVKRKECEERYEAVKTVAEHRFCENPGSETCARWMQFRTAQGYENHDTEIMKLGDEIERVVESMGDTLQTGVKWAIPALIGIAIIFFITRDRK